MKRIPADFVELFKCHALMEVAFVQDPTGRATPPPVHA